MDFINSRSILILHLVALAALCGILFFPHLGRLPFFNKGEPREALVVQDIFLRGDWLFPLRKGEEIPSKPPLFHWFGAFTSIAWGQVTEATVRLPSALFATLGVLIIYILGRGLFDPKVGLLGGIILATSVGYQSQAITARVDMTLTFFVTLTLVIFYLLYQGFLRGRLWSYGFYLLLGVSVLVKGPVGLLLPGMVIFGFLALRKRWEFLSWLCFHKGVVLTLIIGISWYGMALMRGGEDFFSRQVMHENLIRFFGYGEGGAGHQKPLHYYFPYLFLHGLPWSLFLPFVVVDWIKRVHRNHIEESTTFLSIWFLTVFLFFSLSAGKRAVYLLPLYPALSLLIGAWFYSSPRDNWGERIALRLVAGISLLVGLFFLAWLSGKIWMGETMWLLSSLMPELKPKDQADFSMIEQGLHRAEGLFLPFLFLSSLLWVSLARNLWNFRPRAVASRLALISILSGFLTQFVFVPIIAEGRSYGPFMTEVNRRLAHGGQLYLYGGGFDSAMLVFYRGRPIPVLEETPQALAERLTSGDDHFIMREEEWERIYPLDAGLPSPALKSTGSGPDGDANLILVRARPKS